MRLFLLPALAAFVALVACSSSDSSTTTPPPPAHLYSANVYPILQKYCALTGCHGATEASPPLGVKISAVDPNETYMDLVGKASQVAGVSLVQPGDPDNSLIQRMIDGTQDDLAGCAGGKCGSSMPPPDGSSPNPTNELMSQTKRDTIRAWIQDGAKND